MDIENHHPSNLKNLASFIKNYLTAIPDAKLHPAEFYTFHPVLEGGANVFCATGEGGRVLGFAPLFPAPADESCSPGDPHHIWTIVLADPHLENGDAVRLRLLERVLEHASRLREGFPPRPTRLASDLMASQQGDIRFLLNHGFKQYDGMYVMQRSTAAPIIDCPLPKGLMVRHWKMPTWEERDRYLTAFNACFPELPKDHASLDFFLSLPLWINGTAISAFDSHGRLVGSILAYPTESGKWGVTDDVFVLPEWRGRGVARRLVAEGLRYFRACELPDVFLEVRQTNPAAVNLYRSMGFGVVNEEVLLGYWMG